MTTIVKADKHRITVRGVVDGLRYLVREESNGWRVEPAPENRVRREVKHATRDLGEHLDALSDLGFSLSPRTVETVPPCRF